VFSTEVNSSKHQLILRDILFFQSLTGGRIPDIPLFSFGKGSTLFQHGKTSTLISNVLQLFFCYTSNFLLHKTNTMSNNQRYFASLYNFTLIFLANMQKKS